MLKRFLIISICFLLFPGIKTNAENQRTNMKGPITITAVSLTADNKAHTALFENNVVAKTTDITIHADTMLVFYREDGGEVTKIEATGNIRVIKESRLITSNSATYYAAEERVVFNGEPRAMDGNNVISGTSMNYFINDDRFLVENSRVILRSKKEK